MVCVYVLWWSVGCLSVLSFPALVSSLPREACSEFPSRVRFGHLFEPWLPFSQLEDGLIRLAPWNRREALVFIETSDLRLDEDLRSD